MGLFREWMPTNTHPVPPCADDHFVVHLESNHCDTPNSGQSPKMEASFIPGEMLKPEVLTWMK